MCHSISEVAINSLCNILYYAWSKSCSWYTISCDCILFLVWLYSAQHGRILMLTSDSNIVPLNSTEHHLRLVNKTKLSLRYWVGNRSDEGSGAEPCHLTSARHFLPLLSLALLFEACVASLTHSFCCRSLAYAS